MGLSALPQHPLHKQDFSLKVSSQLISHHFTLSSLSGFVKLV